MPFPASTRNSARPVTGVAHLPPPGDEPQPETVRSKRSLKAFFCSVKVRRSPCTVTVLAPSVRVARGPNASDTSWVTGPAAPVFLAVSGPPRPARKKRPSLTS